MSLETIITHDNDKVKYCCC